MRRKDTDCTTNEGTQGNCLVEAVGDDADGGVGLC